MFEILEHTADIGLGVSGATAAELFASAATGLVSIAMETGAIEPRVAYALSASGEDWESLLVSWLNEIIYHLDGKRVALGRFEIERINSREVIARGWGEPRDDERHRPRIVVKAATYHQLRVVEEAGGWRAEVYLDI